MRKLTTALTAAAMLATATSYGLTFDYEYVFKSTVYYADPPVAVTGSFDGTLNGDLITGIQNFTLYINGAKMGLSGIRGQLPGNAAVISSDLAKTDLTVDSSDYSWVFQIRPPQVTPRGTYPGDEYLMWDAYTAYREAHGSAKDTWFVKARSVPDGGMTAMLLGFGMTAIGLIRRKLS